MSAGVLSGLRHWAAGSAADIAAVELLASVADGRLLRTSAPWVQPCVRPGWFWLDANLLAQAAPRLRGRDRQLVALAVVLLGGGQPVWARRAVRSTVAA